ncbi:NADH dehydrogenase [ubiquinone] 1 alpha subcomplex subunit 4-like 2 isoform X1 [Lathamus discolor]|uniref:NADH dehydrogenase [ubiquinone] 1 alpha subcomplex subunit 4-like 2 isoform X1 n=1 Tax=Lathamus discolor TaxID=678569 RepID=UPI0032B7737E
MKGPLLGAMFSRHVKRHPGALITQKVSAADVTQADSYTVYRSPATGLLCHISPVNLPLIPLIGFISVGMGSAVLYLLRLALYSPDVSWDRKNNPEPWNKLSPTDQYKFLAVSTDYKSLKKERPSF